MNKSFVKGILFALLAIYVISPLDLAPGVVDDLLLLIFTAAANGRSKKDDLELLPESKNQPIVK